MGCTCIKKNLEKEINIKCEKGKRTIKIFEDEKLEEFTKNQNIIIKKQNNNKEDDCLLLKIKSKYILNKIKDYIDNFTILKLVSHSKKLQNKLNYELIHYQYYYFMRIKICPIYYFSFNLPYITYLDFLSFDFEDVEEVLKINNIERKTYEAFISNYWKMMDLDKEIFQKLFAIDILFLYDFKEIYNITINYPFLNVLSKSQNFDKYNLKIEINDNYLSNDLINLFNDLNNNNNLIYPKITLKFGLNYKNNLKLFNTIIFDKIKALTIINESTINIYKDIFSYFNNFNNITYLYLDNSNYYYNCKINNIKIINNFKLLKYLFLNRIELENPLILKLYNLIELYIIKCKNIIINDLFNTSNKNKIKNYFVLQKNF